jgi:hypothetical protein
MGIKNGDVKYFLRAKDEGNSLGAFAYPATLSFRSAGSSREESAVPLPAESRFLTGKAGSE